MNDKPITPEERTEAVIELNRIAMLARDMSRIEYNEMEDPNEVIKAISQRIHDLTLRPKYILTGKLSTPQTEIEK